MATGAAAAVLQATLLGLVCSTLAQNNGFQGSSGFFQDYPRSTQNSRLVAKPFHFVPLTTTETPQFVPVNSFVASKTPSNSFQNKPTLIHHQNTNEEDQYINQEPQIQRKQLKQHFIQPQEQEFYQENASPVHISFTQTEEPPKFEKDVYIQNSKHRFAPLDQQDRQLINEKEQREQAKNAKYAFNSAISDTIYDNSHVREEVRDGLKLAGLYSYSDGFYKRTVHYEADDKGYRVVKEDVEPIGDGTGPLVNPNGEIDVSANFDGAGHAYHATLRDIPSLYKDQHAHKNTASQIHLN